MKKTWLTTAVLAAALAAALAASLTACSGGAKETTAAQTEAQATEAGSEAETEASEAEETTAAAGELQKIVVGASPAPHAEILAAAKDVLLSKGYELEIVEYTDYVQPNNCAGFRRSGCQLFPAQAISGFL